MKRFLKALLIFLIPAALLCCLCFAALVKSGELLPVQAAVDVSQSSQALYGLAYRNDVEIFKLQMAQQATPALLVLGTSRSMQIGEELFLQQSFYNAGGATPKTEHFLYFLQSLPPSALPQKLIVVLDQNFFNAAWDVHNSTPDYTANAIRPVYFLQRIIQDFARGKIDFAKIFTAPATQLGLSAIVNGSGYAHDGSYVYGATQADQNNTDKGFAVTFDKINQGNARFEHGSEVCDQCISAIALLVDYCSANNIELVGILPPYAPAVWQAMQQKGTYTYIPKIYTSLLPMFLQKGFEVYDYSGFTASDNSEYIDGYHGSDKTYCRIMLDILPKTTILANEINPQLQDLLLSSSPYELSHS